MADISKEIEADIRKKIEAGSFQTDSDVYDYAEEHGLPARDVDKAIWEIISKNTPCHGCKHIALMSTSMHPCGSCSRRTKDMYEPEDAAGRDGETPPAVPDYEIYAYDKDNDRYDRLFDMRGCAVGGDALPERILEGLAALVRSEQLVAPDGQPYDWLELHENGKRISVR